MKPARTERRGLACELELKLTSPSPLPSTFRSRGLQTDQAEDDRRAQAAKEERLSGAEALDLKSQVAESGGSGEIIILARTPSPPRASVRAHPLSSLAVDLAEEQRKNESVMAGLIKNVINNLQITVKNIHIRYEDRLSTPEVRSLAPLASSRSRPP